MPFASSTDLVMASIQDIIQALQNPTANSPLAPRTDSQVQALQDLTSLLIGIIKQDNHDAPSLRVDAPATLNETTTTTKQSSSMKTSVDNLAPALRVEVKEPLTEPTVPPHQVQADEPATYENSTGAKGRRRRKQARKAKKDKNMQPTASTHTHGTRANVKKHQQGAQPTANTAMQIDSEVHHAALHSNAINPDTGRTSEEYLEISKCSDGHHWIEACANEIGRLCCGHGADSTMTSGKNTMFFIPIKDMPKGRRTTYIRIVCADCPEKVDPQ
jgi:hypothetical protein